MVLSRALVIDETPKPKVDKVEEGGKVIDEDGEQGAEAPVADPVEKFFRFECKD